MAGNADKKNAIKRLSDLKKWNAKNMQDKFWRICNLYKIVDKKGQLITFVPNKWQKRILLRQHRQQLLTGKGARTIVLKARQLGITTIKTIEMLDKTLFNENVNAVITAHKKDKQQDIFRRVKLAYEMMPETIILDDGTRWHKPKVKDNNKNELSFPEINSRISVSLDCRSGTPTDVHITELAFRRDAEEMMTGTLPSIHDSASLTIETTANGIGNYFHNMWLKNYKQDNPKYDTIFLPWYQDSDYVSDEEREVPEDIKHITDPVYMGVKLTQRQINWYVEQHIDLDSKALQELPSHPEEAFLASGDKFISETFLRRLVVPKFHKDTVYEDIYIYKAPEVELSGQYIYGVDTAYGGENWDYSVVMVRQRDGTIVACYRGRKDPEDLVDVIERLLDMGYVGLLGVERNNSGHVTLKHLELRGHSRLIFREKTIDKETQKKVKKLWRLTDEKSRNVMLNNYATSIRMKDINEVDDRTYTELHSFVWVQKTFRRKPEAQAGAHDDTVIADAICWMMSLEPPVVQNMRNSYTPNPEYY